MKQCIAILLILLAVPAVIAGGSQVTLQSIKYQALGHAGGALFLDASTMYFNPGGLAFTPGKFNLTLGVNRIDGRTTFVKENSNYVARTVNPIATPFNFYMSGKLNERVSIGIGVYNPFGSGISWEEGWQGKYLIQSIALRTFYVQPTLSIKLADWLSLGGGYIFGYGDVVLEKDIPIVDQSGERNYAVLEGSGRDDTYTWGVLIRPTKWLNIGYTYKGGTEFDVNNGKAKFYTAEYVADDFPKENRFSAKLPLPESHAFSASVIPNERWLFTTEFDRTNWGVYDSLQIDFAIDNERLQDVNDPKLYQDAWQIRFGAQFKATNWFTARAGFIRDNTPIQADFYGPETPDMDRNAITLGGSFTFLKALSIDFNYTRVQGENYEARYSPANFGGTYQSVANVVSAGVSLTF